MVQPSFGANLLEVFDIQLGWIPLVDVYLKEATEYKLRFHGTQTDVRFQGIPVPFIFKEGVGYATLITPFQSGTIQALINGQKISSFVYPDERKLTETQFSLMLEEILSEANSCFLYSGL